MTVFADKWSQFTEEQLRVMVRRRGLFMSDFEIALATRDELIDELEMADLNQRRTEA
jgi:hypothetical protein